MEWVNQNGHFLMTASNQKTTNTINEKAQTWKFICALPLCSVLATSVTFTSKSTRLPLSVRTLLPQASLPFPSIYQIVPSPAELWCYRWCPLPDLPRLLEILTPNCYFPQKHRQSEPFIFNLHLHVHWILNITLLIWKFISIFTPIMDKWEFGFRVGVMHKGEPNYI